MDIFIDSEFAAAHRLTSVGPGHKCARLHGHTFHVRTVWRGDVSALGWVADFDDLKRILKHEVLDVLDHNYLNDIEGLKNPTSENLAVWIWDKIRRTDVLGSLLVEVQARESCTTGAIYRGPA